MKALRIDIDGTVTEVVVADRDGWLRAVRAAVGGNVAVHPVDVYQEPGGSLVSMMLWCDRDARARRRGVNTPMSQVLRRFVPPTIGPVLGPVLLTGVAPDGFVTDLHPCVSREIRHRLRGHRQRLMAGGEPRRRPGQADRTPRKPA